MHTLDKIGLLLQNASTEIERSLKEMAAANATTSERALCQGLLANKLEMEGDTIPINKENMGFIEVRSQGSLFGKPDLQLGRSLACRHRMQHPPALLA